MNGEGSRVARRGIGDRILLIRGHRVMVDADLAELYGVTTKRLNEQVKRNVARFPADFAFRLSAAERAEVLASRPELARIKFSTTLPQVFTEHGTLMLANVLGSETAVQASIEITRTFVRMREAIIQHHDLARRMDALERKYDGNFQEVFDAIRELMEPDAIGERRIGFRTEEKA